MIFEILYILIAIACFYPFAMMISEAMMASDNRVDRFSMGAIAFMTIWFWPIILVGLGLYWISSKAWERTIGRDEEKVDN